MEQKINNGGPAYPQLPAKKYMGGELGWGDVASGEGMTLRDYFAAKALMSMLSPVQNITDETPGLAAKLSYKFADAMIQARNEKGSDNE